MSLCVAVGCFLRYRAILSCVVVGADFWRPFGLAGGGFSVVGSGVLVAAFWPPLVATGGVLFVVSSGGWFGGFPSVVTGGICGVIAVVVLAGSLAAFWPPTVAIVGGLVVVFAGGFGVAMWVVSTSVSGLFEATRTLWITCP